MRYILIILFFVVSTQVQARNAWLDSLNKKVEVKKKTRWTLADWMNTKNQVGLMDAWLAANTSASLFEFYFGGSQYDFDNFIPASSATATSSDSTINYTVAGFVTIFGLKLENEDEEGIGKYSVEGLLRVLGSAEQGTRLNAFYGAELINDENQSEEYSSHYYGGSLRIYLLGFFAIEGIYQKILETELPDTSKYEGEKVAYGALIDLGPFQFFAKQEETRQYFLNNSLKTRREGLRYGLNIYF